ncbi:MAG: hypothetical protein ACK5PS_13780 [Desulfopila sp.]
MAFFLSINEKFGLKGMLSLQDPAGRKKVLQLRTSVGLPFQQCFDVMIPAMRMPEGVLGPTPGNGLRIYAGKSSVEAGKACVGKIFFFFKKQALKKQKTWEPPEDRPVATIGLAWHSFSQGRNSLRSMLCFFIL